MSKAVKPPNPALEKFVAAMGEELVVAQVLIRRDGTNFTLRHASDRDAAMQRLRVLQPADLRTLAGHTAQGAFRPLRAAPNLADGWHLTVESDEALGEALNQLYPGAVADWFAAQSPAPPVTHYREFTARQTGMYRITTMLDDAQAARMTAICCDAAFCLKRRLWTTTGLAPDPPQSKSIIPCLEPCAVLLEFARKVARLEQDEKAAVAIVPEEIETLRAALRAVLEQNAPKVREADFNAPLNPRRVRLALARLDAASPARPPDSEK